MAAPTVFSTQTSTQGTGSVSSTVTLPAGAVAGDLLIGFFGADGGAISSTWSAGWTEIIDGSAGGATGIVYSVAYKIATGGDANPTVTHTSERSNHIAVRIKAAEWHGTTPPEIATATNTSSTTPNPTSLTWSWGSDDALVIAVAFIDDSPGPGAILSYPTNYSLSNVLCATSTSACIVAIASRGLTAASSEDPGVFTFTSADSWAATTVAVRSAGVAAPTKGIIRPSVRQPMQALLGR